jgi:hypothetical protein
MTRDDLAPIAWMIAGLAALGALDRLRPDRGAGRGAADLIRGEEGAAYTLSYVMTLPIYLFLVCLIVESGLVTVVKIGTVHAAHAAARSAIVWGPASPERAREKATRAAVHAMVPFAGSEDVGTTLTAGSSVYRASRYYAAYRSHTRKGPAPASYLMAKYRTAELATRVELRRDDSRPGGTLEATVTYEMPLHVPGIARLLGSPASWGKGLYSRRITSSAALPYEAPRNADEALGIDYRSD